jgi:FkbM family methyltransferase
MEPYRFARRLRPFWQKYKVVVIEFLGLGSNMKSAAVKKSISAVLKSLKLYNAAVNTIYFVVRNAQNINYRLNATRFYSQLIKEGDLCFDVGANNGNRTNVFLKLGAMVICIEPQQVCVKHLYKLFGNNKSVIVVEKAVAEREGHSELSICKEAPAIATMSDKWKSKGRYSKDHKWTTTQEVTTTTLDALIAEYGLPAFCKIDVEGFEESVLNGLTKPIPIISFEFHKELLHECQQCINHLLSIGPVEFNCSLGESMKMLFPKWVSPDKLYEKLDSLEDEYFQGDIYARFILNL